MIFSKRNCNYPQPKYAQMVAHAVPPLGHGRRARPTTRASRRQVMRPDIYEEAMKEIGYAHGGVDNDAGNAVRRRGLRPDVEPEEYATVVRGQERARLSHGIDKLRLVLLCRWSALLVVICNLGCEQRDLGHEIAIAAARPGRRASLYISSPSPSAARWTRAFCASPGIRWCCVAKGYALAIAHRHADRLLARLSKTFTKAFDPIIQILRPSRRSPGCRSAWCSSERGRAPPAHCSPSRFARCGRPC